MNSAVKQFFDNIPDSEYISDEKAIHALISWFEKDKKQHDKERAFNKKALDASLHSEKASHRKEWIEFKLEAHEADAPVCELLDFIRASLAKDIRQMVGKDGGLSKEKFVSICADMKKEFEIKFLNEIKEKARRNRGEAAQWAEGIRDMLPVSTLQPESRDDFDAINYAANLQLLFNRAIAAFALCYANERHLKASLYNNIVDSELSQRLTNKLRHRASVFQCDSKFREYIDYKIAVEDPDAGVEKDIDNLYKSLKKIRAFHSMACCLSVGVADAAKLPGHINAPIYIKLEAQLKASRVSGPFAKELALINNFLDHIKDMKPEEKTPQMLDRSFMKTLRDGLTSTEYNFLVTEFSRREKQVLDERVRKGAPVPKNYGVQK